MLNKFYFAYGSNLWRKQMKERCPNSTPYSLALLKDYELTFKTNKRGNGVADIIPKKGSKVYGALYEVTDLDISKLDRYEGHPRVYKRQTIKVIVDGKEIEALVYMMNPGFKEKAPNNNYLEKILLGYKDWYIKPNNVLLKVSQLKETI